MIADVVPIRGLVPSATVSPMNRKKPPGPLKRAIEKETETRWKLDGEESVTIQQLLAKPPTINPAAEHARNDLADRVRITS